MNERDCHQRLPIGKDEKILRIVGHHWFAFAGIYLVVGFLVLAILSMIIAVVTHQEAWHLDPSMVNAIAASGLVFAVLVAAFGAVPLTMRKQEALVVTEEAVLIFEKPSLLGNKISQLNLQHVSDVTVHQGAVGAIMGYGTLVIETPGEQDNYQYTMVANPMLVSKEIIEAHENYSAALESGQIRTTLGQRPPVPGSAWRPAPELPPQPQSSEPPADPTK